MASTRKRQRLNGHRLHVAVPASSPGPAESLAKNLDIHRLLAPKVDYSVASRAEQGEGLSPLRALNAAAERDPVMQLENFPVLRPIATREVDPAGFAR